MNSTVFQAKWFICKKFDTATPFSVVRQMTGVFGCKKTASPDYLPPK